MSGEGYIVSCRAVFRSEHEVAYSASWAVEMQQNRYIINVHFPGIRFRLPQLFQCGSWDGKFRHNALFL
jgi:hypothetical protein